MRGAYCLVTLAAAGHGTGRHATDVASNESISGGNLRKKTVSGGNLQQQQQQHEQRPQQVKFGVVIGQNVTLAKARWNYV